MRVKLEDVCKRIYAGGDVPKDRYSEVRTEQFSVPIYANAEKDSGLYGYTNEPRENELSITVAARGTIGFTAIRREPFLPVVRLITVVPDLSKVSERYLYYSLKGIKPKSNGTSIPQLTVPDIKKNYLNLVSLSEQEAVSSNLDRISRIIELREKELKSFDDLIKARFVEVISQSNSIDIKLKDVVETDRIITYGMVKPGKDVEGGVIIIKVKDFPNGIIQTNDFLHSDPELESKYARSRVKAGDLLYSIRGTVGRTAFVTPELEGANITQDTARLSIDTKRFNPNYIRFALGYDEVVRAVESQIKGVAMKGISLSELREIEIPCVDYDAQQVFGEFVEQVDKSKSVVQKSLDEAQLLFDSLMQKYFG